MRKNAPQEGWPLVNINQYIHVKINIVKLPFQKGGALKRGYTVSLKLIHIQIQMICQYFLIVKIWLYNYIQLFLNSALHLRLRALYIVKSNNM